MLTASLLPQPVLLSLAIRFLLAAVVLSPWAVRERVWQAPLRGLANAAILGAGILCLPQILIVLGSRGVAPSLSLVALAAVPVLLAIGGKGTIPTAVCGIAGVIFLSGSDLNVSIRQLPWLLCPIAAACLLAWALARAEDGHGGLSIAGSLFIQCVVAASLFGMVSRVFERQPIGWSGPAVAGFAASALLTAVSGYLLFYWLLGRLGAARLSTLQWTQTLVATIESAALMHLRPGWESLAGAALIGIALLRAFSCRDNDQGVILQITRR